MSDTKFTAGPWSEISESGFVRNMDGHPVASVYGDDPECHPDDRMWANANLIAAAPELYEALKMFVWPYQEGCNLSETERQERGRSALSKARGEKNG